MGNGFLPVPRSFQDDPIWERPAWLGAYTMLQMRAAWSPHTARVGQQRIDLEPGQLPFTQRSFAEYLGWDRRELRKFLDHLEERGLVCYPEGKSRSGHYILELTPSWYVDRRGPYHGNSKKSSEGVPRERQGGGRDYAGPESPPPEKRTTNSERNLKKRTTGHNKDVQREEGEEGEDKRPGARDLSFRQQLNNAFKLLVKIGLRGHKPPGYGEKKQRGKLKQLIKGRGYHATIDAIKGSRQCFPYNDPESPKPFDAFNVEKRFDVFLAAWRSREHVDRKKSRRRAQAEQNREEQRKKVEDQHRRREEWNQELDERFREEDPDTKAKIRARAMKSLPDRDLGKETKEAIMQGMIRQMYAKQKGLKPPQST